MLKRDYIQTLIRSEEGQALLDAITQKADVFPALGPVPAYTRDPKDDKFVACALIGDANYLITEDKDLLVLQVVGNVRIVTPYDLSVLLPDNLDQHPLLPPAVETPGPARTAGLERPAPRYQRFW